MCRSRHDGVMSRRHARDPEYDVIIVGAGMAGLSAARHLMAARRSVIVIDANSEPGGRVRSTKVDDLTLDLGFQLLNPAYPQAQRMLNLKALNLTPWHPRNPQMVTLNVSIPGDLKVKVSRVHIVTAIVINNGSGNC